MYDLCNSGLESDCLIDSRDVNEQVTMYEPPFKNSYHDISHQYAKGQSEVHCSNQRVTLTHHAMRTTMDLMATTPLTVGIIPSYACTDPTMGLEDGYYTPRSPPIVLNCDRHVISDIDLNIFTEVLRSWCGEPPLDSLAVGWYRDYISHHNSIQVERKDIATYLILEPTSNGSATTG